MKTSNASKRRPTIYNHRHAGIQITQEERIGNVAKNPDRSEKITLSSMPDREKLINVVQPCNSPTNKEHRKVLVIELLIDSLSFSLSAESKGESLPISAMISSLL